MEKEFNDKYSALHQKNLALEKAFHKAQQDEKVTLSEELSKLKQQLAEAQACADRVVSLNAELEELKTTRKTQEKENETLSSKNAELVASLATLNAR